MGILDDVVGNLFDPFTRSDKGLVRLIERGERVVGTIDAFRIKSAGDSTNKYWVGVRIGADRVGIRQQLIPHADHARLGGEVICLHHDGRVAIDWPGTLRARGIEPVGDPPVIAGKNTKEPLAPGIEDDRLDAKRLRDGERTTATLAAAEMQTMMGMPTFNHHLDLELADGRSVRVARTFVPEYATYLLSPGTVLPIAVDRKRPDRITVDWVQAAEADAQTS